MAWKFNPFTFKFDYYQKYTEMSGTPPPASSVEQEQYYDQSPVVGSSTSYARQDHTHGTPKEPFQIGGIYMNLTNVDPFLELGYGTWTQVAQGLFLVGTV